MKTYEELKSMTTEDLVRYTMEMQEKYEITEKERKEWYDSWIKQTNRYDALKEALTSIANLA